MEGGGEATLYLERAHGNTFGDPFGLTACSSSIKASLDDWLDCIGNYSVQVSTPTSWPKNTVTNWSYRFANCLLQIVYEYTAFDLARNKNITAILELRLPAWCQQTLQYWSVQQYKF